MMNLQRRDEIRAIAECPNDMHWAQEMRRAVAELLAHIDTLESMRSRLCAALGLPADSAPETVAEAVGARRVVVPEPTYDEWGAIAENARGADIVDFLAGAAAYGLWLREHSRAIPMKDLAKLRDDFNEWAISRATGNAELEHQKADTLWKTWCMIEIPHPTSVQLNEGETRTLLDVLNREPRDLPWFRAPDFQLELPDALRVNQGGAR